MVGILHEDIRIAPCPFCGSESVKVEGTAKRWGENGLGQRIDRLQFCVRCNKCHARGPVASGLHLYASISGDDLPEWHKGRAVLCLEAVRSWNQKEVQKQ